MLNVGQIDRQSLWPLNNNAWLFSVSSDATISGLMREADGMN